MPREDFERRFRFRVNAFIAHPRAPADALAFEVHGQGTGFCQALQVAPKRMGVAGVRSSHHIQHQRCVCDRAGDGADIGQEAKDIGRLVMGHDAERLLDADKPAGRCRDTRRPAAVCTNAQRPSASGDGCRTAARGAARSARPVPGVQRAAVERRFG